jgi:3-oxoacyl-[acyl-carrier protein] reductase
MKLKDKVAIITGAGRGIGRVYALRFAEEGAKVVVADIVVELAQKVVKEIESKGGEALAISVNVSDGISVQELVKKTVDRFGGIDILVNNAAVFAGIGSRKWDSWSVEEWQKMFAVNVIGGWLCAKEVVPHMVTQGKGKIINIASTQTDIGFYLQLPYNASKGAVITMTRALARALGRYNINVNAISPGYTLTEATSDVLGKDSAADEAMVRGRCFRRLEYPEDLVGTAVFLASSDSDFMTGQTIAVDGGEAMR